MTTLTQAINEVFASSKSLFQEKAEGSEPFKAITQTDLMDALREKGWSLPPAGFFIGDVESAGFKIWQGCNFRNGVRRVFSDGSHGRSLSQYQTIIFL